MVGLLARLPAQSRPVTPSPEKVGDSASKIGGQFGLIAHPQELGARLLGPLANKPHQHPIHHRTFVNHHQRALGDFPILDLLQAVAALVGVPFWTQPQRFVEMVVARTDSSISNAIASSTAAALLVGAVRRTGRRET